MVSGKSYKLIAELNGTFNNFVWPVPDLLTNDCFIKLEAIDFTGLKTSKSIGPLSVMDGASPTFTIMTNLDNAKFPEHTDVNIVLNLRDNTGVKIVEAFYTNDKINFKLLNQTVYDQLIKNKNVTFKLTLPGGVTENAQIKWVVKDLFEQINDIFEDSEKSADYTNEATMKRIYGSLQRYLDKTPIFRTYFVLSNKNIAKTDTFLSTIFSANNVNMFLSFF